MARIEGFANFSIVAISRYLQAHTEKCGKDKSCKIFKISLKEVNTCTEKEKISLNQENTFTCPYLEPPFIQQTLFYNRYVTVTSKDCNMLHSK